MNPTTRDTLAVCIVGKLHQKPEHERIKIIREILDLIRIEDLIGLYLQYTKIERRQEETTS